VGKREDRVLLPKTRRRSEKMNKNFEFQRPSNLQEEFEAKNDILSSRFLELSSEEYFYEIFPDKNENDDVVIVLGTLKDKKGECFRGWNDYQS
jgi:hypothetical protein